MGGTFGLRAKKAVDSGVGMAGAQTVERSMMSGDVDVEVWCDVTEESGDWLQLQLLFIPLSSRLILNYWPVMSRSKLRH